VKLQEFSRRLAEAGVGNNPGRIRHRLAARPCPHARLVQPDLTKGRLVWEFDEEAVAWWLADLKSAEIERREASRQTCRTLRVRSLARKRQEVAE
jgi:hypothetical protein